MNIKRSKRFLFVIILIIILSVALGLVIKMKNRNKYQNTGFNVDINKIVPTDHDPVISYYDELKGLRQEIEDNQVFNKKIAVDYSKGNARISKNGGEYKEYSKEELGDGKYTLIALADNDTTVSIKEFEIDTVPPQIIGVQQTRYNTEREIELEEPKEVKKATLKKSNGEEINLKKYLTKKGRKYKVTENGIYTIYAEDYNGNSITFKFTILKE